MEVSNLFTQVDCSPEMKLILTLTSDLYKEPAFDIHKNEDINWVKVVKKAKRNKMLYYVVQKILDNNLCDDALEVFLRRIKRNTQVQIDKYLKTIEAVDIALRGEPYRLIKTYRGFAHETNDVDVLVRNILDVKERFNNWVEIGSLDENKCSHTYEDLLTVELHQQICWGSLKDFFDPSLLWSDKRKAKIGTKDIPLPGIEADLMTLLVHSSYQQYEIQLGELLYIFSLCNKADWRIMAQQAADHNWTAVFYNTVSILNTLHHELYGEPSPIEFPVPLHHKPIRIDFPYVFPTSEFARAILQRGIGNFVKFAGYLEKRITDHESLRVAYDRVVMNSLGSFFIKNVYY